MTAVAAFPLHFLVHGQATAVTSGSAGDLSSGGKSSAWLETALGGTVGEAGLEN